MRSPGARARVPHGFLDVSALSTKVSELYDEKKRNKKCKFGQDPT